MKTQTKERRKGTYWPEILW